MRNIFFLVIFIVKSFSLTGQFKIGDTIPHFTLINNLSESTNLSSFKGKVLLVDFWASWCAPCRKANKKLVDLHKDYSSENFEIVGISLDTDRTKWLKAISKDKIEYTQLIDPHGFDAKTAIQFGVEALPASYLFDTSGNLIAINPTEQVIINQINQIK